MRPFRVLAFVAALTVAVAGLTACQPPPGNIQVDFTAVTRTLDAKTFAMDETGYQGATVLANDATEQQRVKALDLGYMRMDLHYSTPGDPSSKIVCGGGGCNTGPTGDQWIAAIKGAGAVPVVIVATQTATDDANMVRHFNWTNGHVDTTKANYVKYWIIGNEPDLNGYSASSYSGFFNADVDAMKGADPGIKVIGPTTAWNDQPFIKTFLQLSGGRVDIVDWHGYPQSGQSDGDIATLFTWASDTGHGITETRALIQQVVPSRATQIGVEVGEWSLDYAGSAQTHSNFNAVWTADVLGHIAANGGLAMNYGTKCNVLKCATATETDDFGRTYTVHLDDAKAPYRGYQMFTGAGLFRHFGTALVATSTSLPNVDVFASTGGRSIVVVNKSTSAAQPGAFSLTGVAGGTAVSVWQKNQGILNPDPPAHLASTSVAGDGTFSYSLPPMSVTTFVVG